jgi:chromosome segregation ATPase
MSKHEDPLDDALEVIREHFQGTQNELATLLNACATHGQRADEMMAAIDAIRQDVQEAQESLGDVTALRENSRMCNQQVDEQVAALNIIRQELEKNQGDLAALRDANDGYSQKTDKLAVTVDSLYQEVQRTQSDLAILREVGHTHTQQVNELAATLDTFRQTDLTALREANHACQMRSDELAAAMNALRQEFQGIGRIHTDLEKTIRTQSAKYREQLDTHTRELAALNECSKSQTREINDHIDALTNLHKQEQSQRETALATLSKLNERVGALEQQFSEEQAHSADLLNAERERLAALEKCLEAQAEQFGKFDPVLRELHGQIITLHERLEALESIESAHFLDDHEQRLGETEQQIQEQAHTLEEMQQTLEQLALGMPATARFNKILIGGLISAAVIIIVLLVLIGVG